MKFGLAAAVVVAVCALSAVAAADEVPRRPATRQPAARQKVVVLDPVDIVAKQRPIVAVDVQRVRPKLGVRDLKPNLVDRIETAATKDPF